MFLNDAAYYERALSQILRGEKVSPQNYPGHITGRLRMVLEQMYQNGSLIYEAQTLFDLKRDSEFDPKYKGLSHHHFISTSLMQEAEHLASVCVAKGEAVLPFKVLGLDHQDPRLPENSDTGMVLTYGLGPLLQAMSIIRQRHEAFDIQSAPLIIQNTGHFLEEIFRTDGKEWPQRRRRLERLNVYLTAGAAETADLLASLPHTAKIDPSKIEIFDSQLKGFTARQGIFATGDKIKTGHTVAAHRALTPLGGVRFASDVFGKTSSTTEETYSYTGNGEEKLEAFYNYLKDIGPDRIHRYLNRHGYEKIDDVMIIVNDGGLGFCLETVDGERRIDLFSPELFPDSYHRLNPIQSGPGVELAYMKRTGGMSAIMDKLWQSVDQIVAHDPSFTSDNLTAYDTSMYMGVPLRNILRDIERGEEFSYEALGVVSAFSVQKLRVARQPYCSPDLEPETEDYLIPPGQVLPRSHDPQWFMNAPNVHAYTLLQKLVGSDFSADQKLQQAPSKIRLGFLATADMLRRSRSSSELTALKLALKTVEIEKDGKKSKIAVTTQQGPDVWSRYHAGAETLRLIHSQASQGMSITAYDRDVVNLLNDADIFYFGRPVVQNLGWEEKIERIRLLLRAIVRNQTFNWINIVAEKSAVEDVLKLIRHKKSVGFIPQSIDNILTLSDGVPNLNVKDKKNYDPYGVRDAANKIGVIASRGQHKITPVERKYTSNGVVVKNDCMIVTTYFSATNCALSLQKQTDRLGYLLAVNGFSLKFGGGNDGLMKSVAMGFLKGKQELRDKGYHFPNQLIGIQCADTEAIEEKFEVPDGTPDDEYVFRCHPAIEPREASLQRTGVYGMSIMGGGGVGSDEEAFSEFGNRLNGLIDAKTHPFVFFNQQVETSNRMVGVNDPYHDLLPADLQKQMNINWALTPEEIVAQAHTLRASQPETSTLSAGVLKKSLHDVQSGLKDIMEAAVFARLRNNFRPPYEFYTGSEGGLPMAKLPSEALRHDIS